MILIHSQNFYDRQSGQEHKVEVTFGHINPLSNGHYDLRVDGEIHSEHKFKGRAFDEIAEMIKENDWTAVNQVGERGTK